MVANHHLYLFTTPACHYLVYVTDAGQLKTPDNMISVIDTATNTIVATIPVGLQPQGIAYTPNGALAYVADENSNAVSVLNTATYSDCDHPYRVIS